MALDYINHTTTSRLLACWTSRTNVYLIDKTIGDIIGLPTNVTIDLTDQGHRVGICAEHMPPR